MTPSWETALAALAERLDVRGVAHSVAVAEMAERLAVTYSLDAEAARLAGLLHDWCKDASGVDLLRMAEAYGIPISDVDRAVPYLLHAPVAAAELSAEFPGISDEVLAAVGAHTYGSESLTPLEMAVYVADTLEPGRTHAGAEDLRGLVGSVPLTELFERTYADSIRHLLDSRRRIHPGTVATWNRIVGGAAR